MNNRSSLQLSKQRATVLVALGAVALLAGCSGSHRVAGSSSGAPPSVSLPASQAPLPRLSPAVGAGLTRSCDDLRALLMAGGSVGSAARGSASSLPANTRLTSVTLVEAGKVTLAGKGIAAHCLVTGLVNERVSPVDQLKYAITFEMRLPVQWNGRFWHQANGGIDGAVVPASGEYGGGAMTSALAQGFAVLSSDAGHDNRVTRGPGFGFDPQARLDYGYQAVGTLTPIAKAIIRQTYGKAPDRSYIGGCSNGGRHAMVAAARYADEYDGYLMGAPGFNLPKAAIANIFGAQQYVKNASWAGDISTAFTFNERSTVARAILARCDALDGARDGMVQDVSACQQNFNVDRDVPTCTAGRNGECLTQAQKQMVQAIYAGPKLASGQPVYASFPYDVGLTAAGWANWEFNAPLNLDSGAVGFIFAVPPVSPRGFNGPAFSLNANIDQLYAAVHAVDPLYRESAMSFMTPPNPTQLARVRDRGAKILAYHGVSDAIFSITDTENWYRGLERANGGQAERFAKFYPVPGMDHCRGGPSTDQFDVITPLVRWVEEGVAPQAILASARGAGNAGGVNADLPSDWAPNRTRPLCEWPKVARYTGTGSIENAGSFSCR